jgi:general secretion pathway protein C
MSEEPTRNIDSPTRFTSVNISEKIKNFDAAIIAEWFLAKIQRQKSVAFYGKFLTILLCTYFLGDLSAIFLSKYLPEAPAVRVRSMNGFRKFNTLEEYNIIFARNLFNSNGVIPGEETGAPTDLGGAPVKTTLPFELIGTMILEDSASSIATIEDKSATIVYPVRVDDEIPSKAHILKIEPKRVIFINTASGRREYVDLPENEEAPTKVAIGSKSGGSGIEQVAATQFAVDRKEIDKALSDINNILTQARAVPHFENGAPAGYKLFQIVPGSIYSKLGLKDGDVICGFDGQPANDPAVAFQQLSDLKNRSHLDLCVKRDGRQATYGYDFR